MLKSNSIKFFIVILLILGVFFRFTNLEKKVYWHDEVITSINVSGFTGDQVREDIFNNRLVIPEDLMRYQRFNREKNFIETVISFSIHDPLHPPIYYILLRFWNQLLGSSIAITRSLSAIFSLLVLLGIYGICKELFEAPLVGVIAVSLVAISPFQVLYAQEAREYSLWPAIALLSSLALLRAMRLKTKRNWVIYSITIALALYSHLFSVFVIFSHGIYVLILEFFKRNQSNRTIYSYLLSVALGFLIFSPWIILIFVNPAKIDSATSWSQSTESLSFLIKWWARNLGHIFIDIRNSGYNFNHALEKEDLFFAPLLIILVFYSFYFLCRNTTRRTWLFLLTFIGITSLALILPDLLQGGRRSLVARYFMPAYLGIQITVAYLLASQILNFSQQAWKQKAWQAVTVLLISAGIMSCVMSSSAEVWWNKHINYYFPQAARIINQSEFPLVVSDDNRVANALTLSYLLNPNTKLLLGPKLDLHHFLNQEKNQLSAIDAENQGKEFSDIFLLNCSKKLRDRISSSNHYALKPAYNKYGTNLQRLVEK